MTYDDLKDLREHLNKLDRERHELTFDEVGDYPDPPEDRYDR